ncbi:hypothetical protein JOC86_003062 [Bacillus pakistanensis]|uniref:Uncharacterized protein n=1 Tax=Rossellomorea pakistanensis TaxID=992288 RepID=A0ABS2NFB3_9BACI|nr:hypothetical protein [Bacillus pakistanensis]MBM7586510.1 hypothetical protein [Bacillus pakistanensis]
MKEYEAESKEHPFDRLMSNSLKSPFKEEERKDLPEPNNDDIFGQLDQILASLGDLKPLWSQVSPFIKSFFK